MPLWDLQCPVCGHVYRDTRFASLQDRDAWLKHLICSECESSTHRLEAMPAAPSFVVKGFNANNGYSK